MLRGSHPILSCAETRELEATLFAGNEEKEWAAMQQAGRGVSAAVLRDFEEIGGFSRIGRVLVLVGKGHNGGDALIAARQVLAQFPEASAEVVFAFGERSLRPLAAKAWRELAQAAGARVAVRSREECSNDSGAVELCLDGLFGFQFRPPADHAIATLIAHVNGRSIRLRAAVDLPSGGLFRADFTYATGAVKTPVLADERAGRIRYLDLDFFGDEAPGASRVLTPEVLAPLARLRRPHSDKRTYGHLFVVAGSRSYPGAALLAVLAALRSGAGLVTAFVPETLVPAFAARVPEAIWVGWPETPGGGLALEGEYLLRERVDRATALIVGPGFGREPEALALAANLVKTAAVPVLLDADALQPDIVRSAKTKLVLTPHAGEFARVAGGAELQTFSVESGAVVVLKGPVTRIASGAVIHHSFFGGPVLARGGSGDVLAGLIGGLLAQTPNEPELAAARGVVWHGLAADLLARTHGQVAARTTELIGFLAAALRAPLAERSSRDQRF